MHPRSARLLPAILFLVVACGKGDDPPAESGSGGGDARAGGDLTEGARRIRPGSTESGTISESDPMMRGNRGAYHVWTLEGSRGQRLEIDLTSSSFDTYLYLRDDAGLLLAQDDDTGSDNNARIRTILPRDGRYIIVATSYGRSASGDYQLAVNEWPAPAVAAAGRAQGITPGESSDGLLEPGDDLSGDGPYQDRWTIELAENQRVRIQMRSTDVDAYLILLDPDGRTVSINDDTNGRDAEIVTAATRAGRHTILATTFGDHPRVGIYRLNVIDASAESVDTDKGTPPPAPDPEPAGPGRDPKRTPAPGGPIT